jgi:DNA (cytosine-5)-methyltransferase 1
MSVQSFFEVQMKYEPYYNKDVNERAAEKRFSVISCFAGGGGSSTGYRLAGGNILLINEFVEEAITSYKENYPDTPVLVDDIKKYSGQDFLSMANIKEGELDILDGSPPCSAFSVAGKREKGWVGYQEDTRKTYFDDEGNIVQEGELKTKEGIKKYSDGKTQTGIEDLFFEYIRVAREVKPKVIIAENVKGITFGEARPKLFEFVNSFEALGYQVTYKVMNAADYGVAQARERTIFICIRDDVAEAIGLNVLNVNGIFPSPTTKHISMESAIEDIVNDEDEVKELRDYYEGSFQKKFLDKIPFRPEKHLKPSNPQFRDWNPKASCFNMIRPAPAKPCPTLTQQGQKKGLSGVFHYDSNRKLTIKELKRLMSLPEDYKLTGTFDQKAERIGRMVAPKMMAALADSIYEKVIKPYYEVTK